MGACQEIRRLGEGKGSYTGVDIYVSEALYFIPKTCANNLYIAETKGQSCEFSS